MNIYVIFCYYIPGSVKKASHIGVRGISVRSIWGFSVRGLSVRGIWGFFARFCCLCPALLLGAWLFRLLSASAPPPRSWGRGLLDTFFLLRPAPFLGAWPFGHFLPPAPRPVLGRVAFSAPFRFCAPPRSSGRGFFSAYLLLCPAALESFMLTFSWHRPPI